MFSFLKKPKTKQQMVETLLNEMQVDDRTLASFVENLSLVDDRLDIQIKIGQNVDTKILEAHYHQLQQLLYPKGIHEINMNVVVNDDQTKKSSVKTHHPKEKIQTAKPDSKPTTKQDELKAHPRIRHIVVVASGKGGVGKSTTTVNLALALQKMGKRVGVLDADIYGPSIPAMLGVSGIKPDVENEQFIPIDAKGIAMMSIGSLLESDDVPVAWRGIKATGALMQLYNQTNWPNLDYLLIDMPPGTGDIQLTLAQRIPISGAIIVTTPQHIALLDAQKGIEMFYKTDIAVLGVIENMALHTCSQCGHTEEIFGSGGGHKMAQSYQVPLLGQLPLMAKIRQQMDCGQPDALEGDIAKRYQEIAQKIDASIDQHAKEPNQRFF